MKKYFILFVAAACLAVSCKDKDKGPVLSPDENKATLDETCTKAVQMLEVDHWQETADLITASAEALDGVQPTVGVYEWIYGAMANWYEEVKGVYITTYDLTVLQGNIAITDSIRVTEGTGLNIAYALKDGTSVEAKATIKNSNTKALVDEDYDTDADTLVAKTYVIVPASIDATVTAGGKQAASVKITTDVKLASEKPAPTDTYAATMAVSAGDYTFAVTRAKYSDTEIALNASIKYGKTTVVAAKFEAKGKLAFDEDQDLDYKTTTGKVNATFSILDNVELKGDLNYTEFVKLVDTDVKTEAEAKALAAGAEKCVNLTLYIQKTAQAKLGFEPYIAYQSEDGATVEWSAQPVVRFTDGSQYALPEEFFAPDGFPKTIEAVNTALAQMDGFLNGPAEEEEGEGLK